MTFEEAEELLEKHDGEYLKNDKCLVKGLLILEKYKPITSTSAEHDVFHVAEWNDDITEEDVLQLNKYGFHLDSDWEGWSYFT